MKWSYFSELGRKSFHLLIIVVLISYYYIEKAYGKQAAMFCLLIVFFIFLFIEYLRLEYNWKIPFFWRIIRPEEKGKLLGSFYTLCGIIIALAVFDFRIVLTALLMCAFGDSTAAIIRIKFGKRRFFHIKSLEGTGAELVVNLVIGFFVLSNAYQIIAMALTSALVETLSIKINDNLTAPLFAGAVGQIIAFFI